MHRRLGRRLLPLIRRLCVVEALLHPAQLAAEQLLGEAAHLLNGVPRGDRLVGASLSLGQALLSVGHPRLARRYLATELRAEFTATYAALAPPKGEKFTVAAEAVGRRRLRNVCLEYLATIGDAQSLALGLAHFREATTMTDSLAALKALDGHAGAERDEVSAAFYSRAKANSEALVINKWFAVQASTFAPDALQRVQALMKHEAYDGTNPNRVRALVSMFANFNPAAFHALEDVTSRLLVDFGPSFAMPPF